LLETYGRRLKRCQLASAKKTAKQKKAFSRVFFEVTRAFTDHNLFVFFAAAAAADIAKAMGSFERVNRLCHCAQIFTGHGLVFQAIESFYALQSNEGFEGVPAWAKASGAPQARSIVSEIFTAHNCKQFWTLLDECNSHLIFLDIPGQSDAKLISVPRTMRKMVSEVVLPSSITTWWFHTMPRNSEQYDYGNLGARNEYGNGAAQNRYEESYCQEQKIASVKPTCYGNAGCVQINDNESSMSCESTPI
jgi:hypothetical protein